MKAQEVLQRYANGERDFKRVNLRGQSFQGKDLSGADFSEADIRGTNFRGAILQGANFSQVKAGLQRRWVVFLTVVSLALSLIAGLLALIPGLFINYILNFDTNLNHFEQVIIISTCFLVLGVQIFITIRQGLIAGLVTLTVTVAVTFVGFAAAVVFPEILVNLYTGELTVALVVVAAFAGAVIGTLTLVFAVAIAGFLGFVGVLAGAIVGALMVTQALNGALILAFAVAGAFSILGINTYVAWRVLRNNEKDVDAWIGKFAVALTTVTSTIFYKADLTDANFTQARLKNTDLRAKSLIRTCWQDAVQLDFARVGKSLLDQPAVRNLLITGEGYKKSYVGANLEGANLTGVNLESANLKQANLNQAILKDANLKEANLAQTLALGTNFSGTYMTGACLEAWTIDETTILSNVDCQYVFFLEYPNQLGSRERRPHDRDQVFAPGDFEKLYQDIINTVKILLRGGVNRESFAAAFKKVMEEFPEITPDSVQGMEKRGDDVLVTIGVEPDTDKGKLEHTFTTTYEARLEAQKNAALLEAEKRHTQDLKETIAALASSSVTIIDKSTTTSTAMSDRQEKKGIFAENVGGDFNVSNVNLNIDNINSNVTNSIDELPADSEGEQPSLKKQLTQLQNAINEENNIDEQDKAEALNQVQRLAEAGQNPKQEENQTLAKHATKMLKRITGGLPTATKLVEELNKLLPAIQGFFAL